MKQRLIDRYPTRGEAACPWPLRYDTEHHKDHQRLHHHMDTVPHRLAQRIAHNHPGGAIIVWTDRLNDQCVVYAAQRASVEKTLWK